MYPLAFVKTAFGLEEDSDHITVTATIIAISVVRGQVVQIADLPVDFTIKVEDNQDITATCRLVFIGGEENADDSAGTVVAGTENVCLNHEHEKEQRYDETDFTATKDGKYRFEVHSDSGTFTSETADFLFRISGFEPSGTRSANTSTINSTPGKIEAHNWSNNPPVVSCDLGAVTKSGRAVYNIYTVADVSKLTAGNSTEGPIAIYLYNNFSSKNITGDVLLSAPTGDVHIPLKVTRIISECISSQRQSTNNQSSTNQDSQFNPLFRSCLVSSFPGYPFPLTGIDYSINGTTAKDGGNIKASETTQNLLISINNDLTNGNISGHLGPPISLPFDVYQVNTRCKYTSYSSNN